MVGLGLLELQIPLNESGDSGRVTRSITFSGYLPAQEGMDPRSRVLQTLGAQCTTSIRIHAPISICRPSIRVHCPPRLAAAHVKASN